MKAVTQGLTVGASLVLLCCFAVAQENSHPKVIPLNAIVDALEKTQNIMPPQAAYRIVRKYQLFGSRDSRSNSEVVAEVDFRPPARKDYRIQRWSGSDRGQQVVRRILDREVAASSSQARVALTRENYNFGYIGTMMLDGQACYLLQLQPRREEADLIAGQVWIDQHLFFVRRVEGELAKSPSWWLRRVRVTLTFAEMGGTWLQTEMEATADVRIVGSHTLTSHVLDYRSADDVASARTDFQSAIRKR